MRVVLLQCELEHRHQAPHLAGALFVSDLRAAGHEVRCALVHPTAIDALAEWFADPDLVLLDSIFPFALVRRVMAQTDATVVVGGHNALQHVLRGPASHALVGAARQTLGGLVETLERRGPLESVAGLWFRRDGVVDCGPPAPVPTLQSELLPFEPDLDWEYLGPPRAPGSNLRIPSIVAEVGCVWNRSALAPGGAFADTRPRVPDVPLSSRARATFERQFLDAEGGCTFCTFRHLRIPARAPLPLLVQQAKALVERGARGLSLQSEHPLPWLADLIDALGAAGLISRLDELHIRTIPWLLVRHEDDLRAAASRAREHDLRLVLAQIGFEAFDERTLAVFNKGLTAEANRRAARLAADLDAELPALRATGGHGLVPLHPWSTPEDVLTNVAACRADAPWLLPSLSPLARIELYNEWTPLFWKAQDEGLLRRDAASFGWTWEYADPRMGELTAAAAAIGGDAQALEAAARLVLEEPDPQARRAAYLSLRRRRGRSGAG